MEIKQGNRVLVQVKDGTLLETQVLEISPSGKFVSTLVDKGRTWFPIEWCIEILPSCR